MAAALTVDKLYKSYGEIEAVRGASFTINTGECFGILGPNGAGKSTTLQICLAQSKQDSGTIDLLGYTMPEQVLAARQKVGVVPQQDNLDPDFNCIENLTVYAHYFGLQLSAAKINELLEFSGLSTRAHARITTLSGGMQRRLTLARALVNDPEFIFLDEPTTGLDPQARHLIWERLRRLQDTNKTLL
ncbi:MAG: ATP-binding cassette domain-containing protein, partial [Proteobacteria bacterium]|nr:ATP-binding cassette domain-containing protein [Pseudomonadota bacterium]